MLEENRTFADTVEQRALFFVFRNHFLCLHSRVFRK